MKNNITKFLSLAALLCSMSFSLISCGNEEPEIEDNNHTNVSNDTYFDQIQGLWCMVEETNISTGKITYLNAYTYRYCRIYSDDGETLYGQYVSYPSKVFGKSIQIELEKNKIMHNGSEIGTILKCGKDESSVVELEIEWCPNQEIFNPYSYKCIAGYMKDTWSKL